MSQDSVILKPLVLDTLIILNDFLFDKVFDTKFSGVIYFMNNTWPLKFIFSFEEAKKNVIDPNMNYSTFSPLSLNFTIEFWHTSLPQP